MDLFIQVKKAYDILNDSQKRAIYDVVGMKGLKAEGWEVSQSLIDNEFLIEISFSMNRLSVERRLHVKFSTNTNDWLVNVKRDALTK